MEVKLDAYSTHQNGNTRYAAFLYLAEERFEVALQEGVFWLIPHDEHLLCIDCHKVHTVALIFNAARSSK
jgi:hypothetical protein